MKKQAGFTLIELVVVIVILGILAAVAIPRFVNLTDEAGTSAANGVAGAIASGTSVNYAARVAGKTTGTTQLNGTNVCTAALLQGTNPLITGVTLATASGATTDSNTYNVSGTGNCSTAGAGAAVSCTVQGYKGNSVNATVICTD